MEMKADRPFGRGTTATKLAVALTVMVGGCGTGPEPAPEPLPEPAAPPCELTPVTNERPDHITIALLHEVEPSHAPFPGNLSEKTTFRHLYETLISVDCLGQVQPGLAASWRSDDGGRRWEVRLQQEARFWDGAPVTAADVRASWSSGAASLTVLAAGIDSLAIEDARTLIVYFDRPRLDVPRILAEPGLAVAGARSNSRWPRGSGPYRRDPEAAAGLIRTYSSADSQAPVIELRVAPGTDGRDLLEDGADVLVTADPAVIEYASTRTVFDAVPASWDRTYVLLSTTRVRRLWTGGDAGALPAALLGTMARDAVRGDARAHADRSWWDALASCGDVSRMLTGLPPIPRGAFRSGPRRIAFVRGDGVARDLAERIVALATAGASASPHAAALEAAIPRLLNGDDRLLAEALEPDEFAASLREGDDFAYVLAVPSVVLDPCFDMRTLARQAEWLAVEEVPLSSSLIPLVDTRRHVIARRGVGLYWEWDGTVRVSPAAAHER
jgi:hypothetical protein